MLEATVVSFVSELSEAVADIDHDEDGSLDSEYSDIDRQALKTSGLFSNTR